MKIEAVFGGILTLFVVGVAAFALISNFKGSGGGRGGGAPAPEDEAALTLCECYNRGFELAASYSVLDAEYSTHFVLCREQLGADGGAAFTAGWNARTGAKPWDSSCEAYLRRTEG